MKKISIITVCFNDAKNLEKTLHSMSSQVSRDKIEHIIIDGASKDNTSEIISKNNEKIDQWISEKDSGLYDAMNKGIDLAKGEYLWFMNAGDIFYEASTIKNVLSELNHQDILYGAAQLVTEEGISVGAYHKTLPNELTKNSFRKGMVVCHQALIVKKSIAEKYNVNYKIAADIDWAIRCVSKSKEIQKSLFTLCNFQTGGLSKQRQKLALTERFYVLKSHFGIFTTLLAHFEIVINYILVKIGLKKTR